MLRINYILPFPNLSGGVKSSRLIAEAMVRRGHKVRLIFPAKTRPLPSAFKHPRQWIHGFARRVRVFRQRKETHLVHSAAELLPINHHLVEEKHVPDADVTIASWWETMESISKWSSAKGTKVHYIRGHEVFHHQHRQRIVNVYRLDCLKIVIGTWLRRVMEQEYSQSAVVIPNGVDWSQFGLASRSRAAIPTIGLAASDAPVKGTAMALEAIRIVQRQLPQLRVVSFGAAVLRSHRPPRNFTFSLRPRQEHIPAIYRAADCWIVSSLSEGLSMPGLEAAACGCPVVATRCGGVDDYVQDGVNGYLVPVQDPEAMAARLMDILQAGDQEWHRMSDASHAIARTFDWDRSAELLEGALFGALEAARQLGNSSLLNSRRFGAEPISTP